MGHMVTFRLTVDTGNRNMFLREAFPPLAQFPVRPQVMNLEMLSGWQDCIDLLGNTRVGTRIKNCK